MKQTPVRRHPDDRVAPALVENVEENSGWLYITIKTNKMPAERFKADNPSMVRLTW